MKCEVDNTPSWYGFNLVIYPGLESSCGHMIPVLFTMVLLGSAL